MNFHFLNYLDVTFFSDDSLRRDFVAIKEAGFRPGFQRLSDGTHVVSISVHVSDLKIPVTGLHAWDSKLLDPQMRLTLLIAFQSGYPQQSYTGKNLRDLLSTSNVKYVVGLSPNPKPVSSMRG